MGKESEIVGKWVRVMACNARMHDHADKKCVCHLIGCAVKITRPYGAKRVRQEEQRYHMRGHEHIILESDVRVLAEQPPSWLRRLSQAFRIARMLACR